MNSRALLATLSMITVLLVGCHGNDNDPIAEYSVQLVNLTENQPVSPLAIILHRDGYHIYQSGDVASTELEQLAEGGDPADIKTTADNSTTVLSSSTGTAATLPGSTSDFTVQGSGSEILLSLVGMLVNTNDGFIGIDSVNLSQLGLGETLQLVANVYDAGTEMNSELTTTVPGLGGEGFNMTRDDSNAISGHPGVISSADGLPGSGLNQSHRFDNPAARIIVTRTL